MTPLIFGPTASGKSALALSLARERQANILSFDSRQVYTGMDIGTGKDIPPDFQKTPWSVLPNISVYRDENALTLFGFDILAPNQDFSIRHYYEYAQPIIAWHQNHNKPLILVGGSWPYAQVLLQPPESLFVPPLPQLRQKARSQSVLELQTWLQETNPEIWQRLKKADQSNPRRLVRALEVALQPPTSLPTALVSDPQLTLLEVSLPDLEERIKKRITARLQAGFLEEVSRLMQEYPDWSTPAFQACGYLLAREHILGKLSHEELVSLWFLEERHYSKRQLTWLNSAVIKNIVHQ